MRAVSSVLFEDFLRTIAWETASHIALRNCSKEVRGDVSVYVILVKVVLYMQSSTHLGRRLLLVTRKRCPY